MSCADELKVPFCVEGGKLSVFKNPLSYFLIVFLIATCAGICILAFVMVAVYFTNKKSVTRKLQKPNRELLKKVLFVYGLLFLSAFYVVGRNPWIAKGFFCSTHDLCDCILKKDKNMTAQEAAVLAKKAYRFKDNVHQMRMNRSDLFSNFWRQQANDELKSDVSKIDAACRRAFGIRDTDMDEATSMLANGILFT